MNIYLNDILTPLPNDFMTIADLVNWKNIPSQGTAIAINDKLVRQNMWSVTNLKENDRITVISAAFGG